MKSPSRTARSLLVTAAALLFACASTEKSANSDLLRNPRPTPAQRPQPANEAVSGQAPRGQVEGAGTHERFTSLSASSAGYCLECSQQKELCVQALAGRRALRRRTVADAPLVDEAEKVSAACRSCTRTCGPNLFKQ